MIFAPSSSSCCFCWNAVSQPSVSPLCDLINECWATRMDPLWGGHIWTLYIEIHICLSLPSLCLSVSRFHHSPMHCSAFTSHFLLLSSSSLHHLLFVFICPLFVLFLFFFISSPPSHLSSVKAKPFCCPSLPQEPLTSAGCDAKVVHLSVPAGSGSLCSECLTDEVRTGEGEKEVETRVCREDQYHWLVLNQKAYI